MCIADNYMKHNIINYQLYWLWVVLTYIRLNDLQNAWVPTDTGSDHSEVKDVDRCCTSCVSYAYIGEAS